MQVNPITEELVRSNQSLFLHTISFDLHLPFYFLVFKISLSKFIRDKLPSALAIFLFFIFFVGWMVG